jgi:radical SAM superfamily enzyme YgiQ (UPF0313 family)
MFQEMKVLLTTPPKPRGEGVRPFYPSLGLLYLASYAEASSSFDLDVTYLEGGFYNESELIAKVSKINPDIVGLTFTSTSSEVAYNAVDRIKAEFENIIVVCGGPHATAVPSDVLRKSRADVCVVGEGEITFRELLKAYEEKQKLSSVPGLAFRQDGKIITTKIREFIKDLDSIPFPAWDKVDLTNYTGYQLKKAWPDVSILSTRGCPYNCVFCSNPVWKHCKPWIRIRSVGNILKEIKYLVGRGAKEIYDFADEFNADVNHSTKLAEAIAQMNLGVSFKVQLRADRITEELAQALNKMGCWLAYVGIESANQEVLDGVGKKLSLKQAMKGLSLLKKYGIKTQGYFMIFNVWEENGQLKFETPKMAQKTLKLARELVSGGLLDAISWSIATPMPGSQLYDMSLRRGLLDPDASLNAAGEKMLLTLPGLTKQNISRIKFEGMSLQLYLSLFHGNVNWRNSSFLTGKLKTLLQYGLESILQF